VAGGRAAFVAPGAFRDEHAREGTGGPKCVEVDRMSAGFSGAVARRPTLNGRVPYAVRRRNAVSSHYVGSITRKWPFAREGGCPEDPGAVAWHGVPGDQHEPIPASDKQRLYGRSCSMRIDLNHFS